MCFVTPVPGWAFLLLLVSAVAWAMWARLGINAAYGDAQVEVDPVGEDDIDGDIKDAAEEAEEAQARPALYLVHGLAQGSPEPWQGPHRGHIKGPYEVYDWSVHGI